MRTLLATVLFCVTACGGSDDNPEPHSSHVCEVPHGHWEVRLTWQSSKGDACKPSDLREFDFDAAEADPACTIVSTSSDDAGCHTVQHMRCVTPGRAGVPTYVRDTSFALDYAGPRELTGTLALELQVGPEYCDGKYEAALTQ